jgi:hypothetical protein
MEVMIGAEDSAASEDIVNCETVKLLATKAKK